jgi:phosphatidylethanolamine/phosphatidyl-N-methylethanolamine N-methyltransferase
MVNEDQDWLDYRARFADVYDESNYANPLQSTVMRANHRLTENNFKEHDHFARVLEIGAETGEHLDFVQHGFDQYFYPILMQRHLKSLKEN